MMREVVCDTETTGVDPAAGDRIIEVGCVEIVDGLPTGRELHLYINPQRTVPAESVKIHGLTNEFLADKPTFSEVANEILAFLGRDPMVAHNAEFDRSFLNHEFQRCGLPQIAKERTVDTTELARRKFPGSPVSLDALCRRFQIDRTHRKMHGAIIDARLLAAVYLELRGGRQRSLDLGIDAPRENGVDALFARAMETARRTPRLFPPSPEELAAHAEFLKSIKNPIWLAG